jgi:hypothetical protein
MLSGFAFGSLAIRTIWRRRDAMEWQGTLSAGLSLNRKAAAYGRCHLSAWRTLFYFVVPTRMEPGNDT